MFEEEIHVRGSTASPYLKYAKWRAVKVYNTTNKKTTYQLSVDSPLILIRTVHFYSADFAVWHTRITV